MPSDRNASIYWYHSDSLVAPDGLSVDPFTKVGAAGIVTLTDDGVEIDDNAVGQPLYYYQQAVASDSMTSPSRHRDNMQVQAVVTGAAFASSWPSGRSGILLFIDDGLQSLGVSIGDDLVLIAPNTGDFLWAAREGHNWLFAHTYCLRKWGSARWVLEVDGVVVATVPYRVSAPSLGGAARIGFGSLDAGGTARATFQAVETSCNRALAPRWLVDRMAVSLPAPMQARWNDVARAWLYATAGLVQGAYEALAWLWTDMQADVYADDTYVLVGTSLPLDTDPPWSVVGAPVVTIVRERVRFAAPGTPAEKVLRATFVTLPGFVALSGIQRIGGFLTIRSSTPDAFGRVGPVLRLRHYGRVIHAQLYLDPAVANEPRWVLTDAVLAGGPVTPVAGAIPCPVNINVEHQVEVQAYGTADVLLLVDRVIVDRRPFGVFPALGGGERADFLVPGSGALVPVCTVDLRGWVASRSFGDLSRRHLLEQRAVEALQFTSGRDRNDELDTWVTHHREVEAARGTTVGIIVELRRLAVEDDNVFVIRDQEPGSWFLELSWPEVTPIYLELGGYFADVFVEFVNNSPVLVTAELAELAWRYLVPLSAEELQYHVCVITVLTAPMAIPGPGVWRVTVESTAEFAAGQTVTVRTSDNVTKATTTVIVVSTPTQMDLVAQGSAAPYVAGSIVRKILRTT